MDSFLIADGRNNVNFWDFPVLYGEKGEILIPEGERKDLDSSGPGDQQSVKYSGVAPAVQLSKEHDQQPHKGKRECLPILFAKGSFYEVGYKIGRTFSNLIKDYTENHRDVQMYMKLYETPKGKDVYDSCFDAVSRAYPEYIRELRGISDGSKVPFYKLFLLHMEDVMLVAWPPGEEKPVPLSGSTTLIVTDDHSQLMGHVVDLTSLAMGNAYLVNVIITEANHEQEFAALCIGGMLAGNTIASNCHGLAFVVDPVPVRKCNECGIPRSIVCRAALSAVSYSKLGTMVQCTGMGIANGVAISVSQLQLPVHSRTFRCYEAGPHYPAHSTSAVNVYTIQPPNIKTYYHMNKFQHLIGVQEHIYKGHASWMVSKANLLRKQDKHSMAEMIERVLGDSSIESSHLSNIFTSVESQGMVSIAVGILDFLEETWSLYLDSPAEANPITVIPIATNSSGLIKTQTALIS